MIDDKTTCPVCCSPAHFVRPLPDTMVKIICPQCESYEIHGPTVAQLREYHTLTPEEQQDSRTLTAPAKVWLPYLSDYLQSVNEVGRIPRLREDWPQRVRLWVLKHEVSSPWRRHRALLPGSPVSEPCQLRSFATTMPDRR